eukprot:TRINITY_DN3280_c0_g1_i1.p1 TRINITY_DN3280_c0_g1~~TRINITY_DN3280_c0_g1_i1.p1  ORF type:complete len:260 (+),score=68.04 TRINITY_DN3280_c0_g1_i1:195-974(+)
MKAPVLVFLALLLTVTWAAPVSTIPNKKPMVASIGDSWAAFASDTLQKVFDRHLPSFGVKLLNHGIPGSTASVWAANGTGLVAAAAGADYVWLSIGGNDVMGYYASGQGSSCMANVERDTRKMLTDLFAVLPEIQVVMFGYDLVNFVHTPLCIAEALKIFPNDSSQPQINKIFLSLGDLQQKIAADYPQVTYVSLWGTLQSQKDSGVPAPYPNVLYPSPAKYMGKDDCIHCNTEGWDLLMEQLYEKYFQGKFQTDNNYD